MRMSECRRKRKLGSGSENGLIDKSTQLLTGMVAFLTRIARLNFYGRSVKIKLDVLKSIRH